MIEIHEIGFYAQLVDKGRRLSSHLGFAPSGALDWQSFELANALLGQRFAVSEPHHVAIEITLGDAVIGFHSDMLIAITGASAQCKIDGQLCQMNCPLLVKQGERLSITKIGQSNQGMRVYIALRASLDTPRLFESAANVMREGSGGQHGDGSALRAGDKLPLHSTCKRLADAAPEMLAEYADASAYAQQLNQSCSSEPNIWFMPAYQWDSFAPTERFKLLNLNFTVSTDCDRMGVRLQGESLQTSERKLYSQGLCNGAIQCAGDGQLIVMLNDRQTIGGYPVLGAVDAFSRSRLAQCQPGAVLRFAITDELKVAAKLAMWSQQMSNLAAFVNENIVSG